MFTGRLFEIGGNLNTARTIAFSGALLGNMRVKGSLLGSLNIGAQGLAGQVVINSNNLGGTWTGPVTVGTSTLAPIPAYAQTSVSLGGGAVGLVPFSFYAADTDLAPIPQCQINYGCAALPALTGMTLKFYGPVYWRQPAAGQTLRGSPVKVRLYLPATQQEIAVTHMMSALADDVRGGTLSREITLFGQQSTPLMPGEYRVYRNGDWLVCDIPGTDLVPVAGDLLGSFIVLCDCDRDGTPDDCVTPTGCARWSGCPADFNRDGTLDFFDYDDFQSCFEMISCPPNTTADFNRDGSIDFFDYDDFVAAFEAGC